MEQKETYTKKTYGYCKCSPLDVIVRFENSNLTSFNWGHRYTFLNDTEKLTNIFRCSKCKEVIHDNFVVEMEKQKDIKYNEMLEILEIYLADLNNLIPPSNAQRSRIYDVEQLIKEATELKQQ